MELIFTIDNIAAAARQVILEISNIKVVAFNGEMGAGKTTFIRALCMEWGIKDTVSSPTFSIINPYQTPNGTIIYHMDLYRVKDEDEAINAGVEDYLLSGNICLIEWPDKIPGLLPPGTLFISIEPVGTTTRKITIK